VSGVGVHHELYGPFTPGTSPFRTKGTAYQGLCASFDRRVPGGSTAVFSRLEDPVVGRFFDQQFLAGSTYDILPLLEASMLAAKVASQPWREFVRGGAAFQAERDLNGVYKVLLKLASPRLVVERLPRVLVQYFNFGRVSGSFSGKTRYEASAHGIPKPVAPWLAAVGEGFIPKVMTAAGAKEVAVLAHPFERDGTEQGMDILSTRFSVTWLE
jgi:hypothetical protein